MQNVPPPSPSPVMVSEPSRFSLIASVGAIGANDAGQDQFPTNWFPAVVVLELVQRTRPAAAAQNAKVESAARSEWWRAN